MVVRVIVGLTLTVAAFSVAGRRLWDIGNVLAATAKSGGDAVHPGHGFQSENADFTKSAQPGGSLTSSAVICEIVNLPPAQVLEEN